MPSTRELFGLNENGEPRVDLRPPSGDGPSPDLILPMCYRNTPWALTTAHALGLGVYREGGLIQYVDDPGLWHDIGYAVVSGSLTAGALVSLKRSPAATPSFFETLVKPDDSVAHAAYTGELEQANEVALAIERNLGEDELEAEDILIVLPDAITSRKSGQIIMQALERRGISSHLAGVTSSPDEVFVRGSVAIASIFRAKGNEAAMVYVLNAHRCFEGFDLQRLRNTLFTAITRSRAWVRVSGWGELMTKVSEEMDKVRTSGYELRFRVPTPVELARMRTMHRDRSREELDEIERSVSGVRRLLELVNRGELDFDALPIDVRTAIFRMGAAVNLDDSGVE